MPRSRDRVESTARRRRYGSESAGCDYQAKVRYPNERVARVKAARMRAAYGIDVRPYKCPGCREWHLTRRRV